MSTSHPAESSPPSRQKTSRRRPAPGHPQPPAGGRRRGIPCPRLRGDDRHPARGSRRGLRPDAVPGVGKQTRTAARLHGKRSRRRHRLAGRRRPAIHRLATPRPADRTAALVTEIAERAATGWSLYRDAAAVDPEIAADWNELQLLRHRLFSRILGDIPASAHRRRPHHEDCRRHGMDHRQPRELRPSRPPPRLPARRIPRLDETEPDRSHTCPLTTTGTNAATQVRQTARGPRARPGEL